MWVSTTPESERDRAERWLEPKLMTTVLACPASMAWAARATIISKAEPPAKVESVHVGSRPK